MAGVKGGEHVWLLLEIFEALANTVRLLERENAPDAVWVEFYTRIFKGGPALGPRTLSWLETKAAVRPAVA